MKRYIHLVLLVVLSLSSAHAQRIHAYVNAGTIGAQIEGDELKGMDHWGFTGGVGAFASLDDNDTWGLAIETDYSCRGVYHNKMSSNNYYNIKLDLHYIDIPITLFFRDPIGGMNIGLGLTYGRLIYQPHGIIHYNPNYFMPDTSDMQFLKNDLAPAIELRFNFWRGLQLSARYQYSILKTKKDWQFFDIHNDKTWSNDCQNQSIQLRLIWQFGDEDTRYKSKYKSSKKKRRY